MMKLVVKKSACVIAMIVAMAQLSFTSVKKDSHPVETVKKAITANVNKYASLYDSLHLGIAGLS